MDVCRTNFARLAQNKVIAGNVPPHMASPSEFTWLRLNWNGRAPLCKFAKNPLPFCKINRFVVFWQPMWSHFKQFMSEKLWETSEYAYSSTGEVAFAWLHLIYMGHRMVQFFSKRKHDCGRIWSNFCSTGPKTEMIVGCIPSQILRPPEFTWLALNWNGTALLLQTRKIKLFVVFWSPLWPNFWQFTSDCHKSYRDFGIEDIVKEKYNVQYDHRTTTTVQFTL